ncbi:MAG: polymorphic toxin-type HINT domain-containing protein [Planctomycetota bacterium]
MLATKNTGELALKKSSASSTRRQITSAISPFARRTAASRRRLARRTIIRSGVQDKGWVTADKLRAGDQLVQFDESIAILEATVYEPHPEGIAIYNFEVEAFHTYFVRRRRARAPPVFVHNNPLADPPPPPLKSFADLMDADEAARYRKYWSEN